jgi:glutathione S-transferase
MLLLGTNLSPFTRRVAISLSLLGFAFERKPLTAWKHLDEVRRFNPVGRTPALVLDDGEALFDSAVILDYADGLVGPRKALIPPQGAERRQVLRLTAAAVGVIEKAVVARYEVVMRPQDKVHEPWLEHNRSQVRSGIEWLSRHVAGPWFAGEHLTQADVTVVVMYDFVRLVDENLLPLGAFDKLDRLVERAYELEPFADTVPNAG